MGEQNGVASDSLWYEITLYLYWWSISYHRLKLVLLRYNRICILLLLWVFTLQVWQCLKQERLSQ